MKKILVLQCVFLVFLTDAKAQNIGIGTTIPNSDAMLEISSTSKGLLIPRLALQATNQPQPLSTYVEGMLVYNTATAGPANAAVYPGFYYCTDNSWKRVSDNSNSWLTTGNYGTNAGNFIGNIGFSPLTFKTNNQQAGLIVIPQKNTFFGYTAGFFNPGYDNVAIGDSALYTSTNSNSNTAIGARAMRLTTSGNSNTAVGLQALMNNTLGSANVGMGVSALVNNISGSGNVAIGNNTLINNQAGSNNTAIGTQALFTNQTGNNNTAIGIQSLQSNTADGNTAVGAGSLSANIGGFSNTAVGFNALTFSVNGNGNSALGNSALKNNVSGNNNIAFGVNALLSLQSGQNNTAVGVGALRVNLIENANTCVGFQTLFNNTGAENTAIGNQALFTNSTGVKNTALGDLAGNGITTGSNNVAIGYNAQVPNPAADNQVRIGDANISYAGIQVAWTITSDSRWKSDIENAGLGLSFIRELRPVSYVRINDNSHKLEYGFIAQEVETLLNRFGAANTGMITKDAAGMYSMRYNDLIAPIVRSIQEQQLMIDELRNEVSLLKALLEKK